MDIPTQPSIVIAAADPEWAFALQGRIRAAVGWSYDILITFTAAQALDYVLRRGPALLITAPRMVRRADVMDVPELLERVRERAPGLRVLLADGGQPLDPDQLSAAACRLLGVAA